MFRPFFQFLLVHQSILICLKKTRLSSVPDRNSSLMIRCYVASNLERNYGLCTKHCRLKRECYVKDIRLPNLVQKYVITYQKQTRLRAISRGFCSCSDELLRLIKWVTQKSTYCSKNASYVTVWRFSLISNEVSRCM